MKAKLFFFLIFVFSCGKKEIEIFKNVPSDIESIFVAPYMSKWNNHQLTSKNLLSIIHEHLGKKFTVIWKGDVDADSINDYLVIIKRNGWYKCIEKALLIDDNKSIKFIFDKNKGIFSKNKIIYNFRKIGIKQNEVQCIRLLINFKQFLFTKNDFKKLYKKNNLNKTDKYGIGNGFSFQLIDKEGNLIGVSPFLENKYMKFDVFQVAINITIKHPKPIVSYDFMNGNQSVDSAYRQIRRWINLYRKNKAIGDTIKAINIIP